ncbi:hypothetical protein JR316_0004673 [Psilocybe cubensis]|uniref:Uncharacterized protein n=2 Tax=Psilocybe cubensis TaxID=181762 RepID=A0ACB8H3U0_PSICU|nr:hypothetical protein JR316_0004673 [Psilocybe cubensis]KAH9482573.1 hypothetical protein JR316_0004673 [Psilocybe cubensis]
MGTKSIDKMLEHIYGPYTEAILRADFPRPGVKLVMNDLRLFFKGDPKPTGFDETEYITSPPVGSRISKNPDVIFMGVIEIDDLEWLSDEGLVYLTRDVQEVAGNEGIANLTLQRLYSARRADAARVKVRLYCRKSLLAHFLTSTTDPDKLLIYSQYEQTKRTYSVESYYWGTLRKSQNFLERYRLRALVAELVEIDRHTPPEDRDIEWAIRQYMDIILPRDKQKRFFVEPGHQYAPRHLRHIPRAYIRSLFAEHAEWLLAHMIARKQGSANLFDVQKWISFCKQARKDSQEAKKAGEMWGNYTQDPVEPLARSLARYGETEQFWENQLRLVKKKRTKPIRRSPEPIHDIQIPHPQNDIRFQYDSDFSDESTSETSESEVSEVAKHGKIPSFCFEPPSIPIGCFVWNCPGCTYKIDLLNMQQGQLDALPETIKRILKAPSKGEEDPVHTVLYHLVSYHYESVHISGYRVHASKSKWVARDSYLDQNRQMKEHKVKVEESSQVLPLRRSKRPPCPRRVMAD